ncbi:MAG: TRAP transporter substrate-binding protein DctP [Lachnospiraceae bacterium]|nr:TRAP transporter substrate-binding protein DctP [Lachnospiraceae bacterium]MCI9657658.1 TRAP transporter substrate-binding protein DctP [Lachnospiraceae bacterium]
MKTKKIIAWALVASTLFAAGCGQNSAPVSPAPDAAENSTETPVQTEASDPDAVVLQIGFENSITEPVGQALTRWQELVEEKGDGSIRIELYPDSQLGSKNELIDSMLLGEPVCTLCDGSFYADYGVPDFSITYAPYLFENWEQCWTLIESDWYAEQSRLLEEKGLKLISSNWIYGARHTLTTKKVEALSDLKGLKIRVPNNRIQSLSFDNLGATSVGMDLGEVYQSLQTGTIDGAENPLATLYGRKLQEVAKYLLLDGHVLNFTTWVCSADFFNSLTPEQQTLLQETGKEAGLYNNELQQASEDDYLQMMVDEGVTVTEPSEELLTELKDASSRIYQMEEEFGWSEGLYDTVRKAMGAE